MLERILDRMFVAERLAATQPSAVFGRPVEPDALLGQPGGEREETARARPLGSAFYQPFLAALREEVFEAIDLDPPTFTNVSIRSSRELIQHGRVEKVRDLARPVDASS